jgi:flagellar basal-body rod modification protein FlgD
MAVSATAMSASDIQMDYMKILIAQLQNQNPLEPLNNNEMASQLAQLSQLGQIETLNSNFAKVLETAERNYASSLIGKDVTFYAQTEDGDQVPVSGKVEQVYNDADGKVGLLIGGNVIGLEDIVAVTS